jgi:hypothetical protein
MKLFIIFEIKMTLFLKRWIEHLDEDGEVGFIPQGEFANFTIRVDRVDGFSVEDDELVLIIGGNEFFFEYEKSAHKQLEKYFKGLIDFRLN